MEHDNALLLMGCNMGVDTELEKNIFRFASVLVPSWILASPPIIRWLGFRYDVPKYTQTYTTYVMEEVLGSGVTHVSAFAHSISFQFHFTSFPSYIC